MMITQMERISQTGFIGNQMQRMDNGSQANLKREN